MRANVQVEITEADILAGKTSSCKECPIALATKRVVKFYKVSVGALHIILWQKRQPNLKFRLDGALREFVDDFDCGQSVRPMKFELDFTNNIAKVIYDRSKRTSYCY